jgi:ATP-dependent RNA helicase DDX52/ROK1
MVKSVCIIAWILYWVVSFVLSSIAHVLLESGCEVPEYMLTMKKASKRARRKLENRAPYRESISSVPAYETERVKKLK